MESILSKIGNGDAWTFDDELADPVGTINSTALVSNNVTFNAGEFIGGSYAPINSTSGFYSELSGVVSFASASATVALWIKVSGDAPVGSGLGAFANPLSISTDGSIAISISQSYTEGGGCSVSASCVTFEGFTDQTSEVAVAYGEWIHVAVVRSASGFDFYVNGTLAESVQVSIGGTYVGDSGDYLVAVGGMLRIPTGRSCNPAGDELLIAHGELTSGEISWLYNEGAGRSMNIFAP